MQTILQDLRYALRQLRRSPAFAVTAVLTLALGIGANTAIFSLLDQALLRSLPVRDPRQLVILEGTGKAWEGHSSSWGGDPEAYFSYPMYKDLRDHSRAFQGLIATSPADVDLSWHGNAQIASVELVSGNYFSLLGAQVHRGRLLTQSDDTAPGANSVAVLSFDYWKNHLGADSSIVGQTLSFNGHPFQIVGVVAPGFHSAVWGQTPALFAPMSMLGQIIPGQESRLTNHRDRWMNILGRLNTGESIEQAGVAMAPLWHALRAEELKSLGHKSKRFEKDFLTDSRMLVLPGARGLSYSRDGLQKPLLVVMGMAVLVLIIASVNVASLLLVRSAARVREFSLRAALGASGSRIVAQLMMEGLLIGVLGGAVGLLLAPAALRILVHRLAQTDEVSAFSSSLDTRVLLFNFAVAVFVSLLFSLAPALQLRKPSLTTALRESSATASGGLLSLRRLIVCLQIGLSVLLLAASGLFVRTMQKLRAVDVGFNTTHLVSFSVYPSLAGYTRDRLPALQQRIFESLSALPGIRGVAATDDPLLTGSSQGGNITIDGYTPAPDEQLDIEKTAANPAFFSTMEMPLLAGRAFSDADSETAPKVAIVNEDFARKYFGDARHALGHHLMDGASNKPAFDTEIVGVIRDYRHTGIRDLPEPTLFLPLRQATSHAVRKNYVYLRTAAAPADSFNAVRQAMQQLDPALAVDELNTMDGQIETVLRNDSIVTLLAISFGVLATLLGGVGLYGVLAYATAQRTREIGIRIALGSSRLAVARIILADVLTLAGIGIVVGLPVAYALSRLLRSQLFGVSPADPISLAAAVLLVALIAVIAALIPARRAASVNPTEALRTE